MRSSAGRIMKLMFYFHVYMALRGKWGGGGGGGYKVSIVTHYILTQTPGED